MGRPKKLTDEERITNKKAFRSMYFEKKRLEIINATSDIRRCAYCEKDYGINSFRNKNDLKPNLVCRSCILTYDFCNIVEKLAIKNEAGCILWPENDRTSDYYYALIGTNNNSNLELACWECNINKGNKSICNWRNKLEFWITKNKNINKLQLYKSILVNLSNNNTIVNDEFVARHMRNKTNE